MKLDNELRRELRQNINRLRDLGTYRGRRHAQVRNLCLFLSGWRLMEFLLNMSIGTCGDMGLTFV